MRSKFQTEKGDYNLCLRKTVAGIEFKKEKYV